MYAKVLITCSSGVDGSTINWQLDLTTLKQIQPFAGAKQHHLRLSLL